MAVGYGAAKKCEDGNSDICAQRKLYDREKSDFEVVTEPYRVACAQRYAYIRSTIVEALEQDQ